MPQADGLARPETRVAARERSDAAGLLDDNPRLKPQRDEMFARAYRKEAAAETGLPLSAFPVKPPFTLEQMLDEACLPND